MIHKVVVADYCRKPVQGMICTRLWFFETGLSKVSPMHSVKSELSKSWTTLSKSQTNCSWNVLPTLSNWWLGTI